MAEGEKPADSGAGFETGAFESLESDFQEVLQELVGDKSLERFRSEYEKLHRALKKSHESEKRLIKKCRELNQEIVANAAKVQTALKLSQEDQNTIASLKREIEKAWKMVDAAHEKEGRAKETIQQLKHEIQNLSRLVEQGAGLSVGQESTVNELLKLRSELQKERDAQAVQIAHLKAEVGDYLAKMRALEVEAAHTAGEVDKLRDVIAEKKADSEKELKIKQRLEKEVAATRELLDERQANIKEKQDLLAKSTGGAARLEVLLRDERGRTDKSVKETEVLLQKALKLQRETDDEAHGVSGLAAEHAQRKNELGLRCDELAATKLEVARQLKMTENYAKKCGKSNERVAAAERARELAKARNVELEEELAGVRAERETTRKALDVQLRERDIENKHLVKAGVSNAKQVDLVKVNENTRKNLEQEIAGYKSDAHTQRKVIFLLEKEGEKYGAEAGEASAKYAQALEEVKIRELSIIQLQKRISDGETKLKQQQSLYEAVRSDRNLYSKNLIESQDEIAEMKRRFKIMNKQIEQLKDEIREKDQSLVKEHFDHMKVEKEKDNLKDNHSKLKSLGGKNDELVGQFSSEISKLNAIINEADQERERQEKECGILCNERDILGTQLVRRNEELALIYERIRIQQSTLDKGRTQYAERLKELRLLKTFIKEQTGELQGLLGSTANLETLRNEVYQLQRELLQERTKVRALSEELENPINVHRWRKLEGSDPATYELVQKIHMLQRRLIEKSEEVVDKELLIHHKEKLYLELKNILARQPGPEVAEQLSLYQHSLQERGRQTEQMGSELSMLHAQAGEYKYEIGRVTKELRETKKKYFEQKKREQHSLDILRAANTQPPEVRAHEARATLSRFTGGGFNLNQLAT